MSYDVEYLRSDPLSAGGTALARGDWKEARMYFTAANARQETPEALEGLGMAAWWLDEATLTFDARERAYRLYRAQGDCRGAARMATYLAYDYFSFRGEYAVANGWFQRAHRLLKDLDTVPEQSLLAIYEGYLALMVHHDPGKARVLATRAELVGRTVGIVDFEMLGLALEGLARVSEGEIAEGMRCLDESVAAAVSGEMTDPDARAQVCCYLIFACERVRDYDRAAQWCAYMRDFTLRWQYPTMFSYCRMHYAGVLIWRGDWSEAEATLVAATNDLILTRPTEAVEGIVRLADLRRRQGRYEDALALLAQADSHPFRLMGRHIVLLGRAAIALDQRDMTVVVDLAERFLRSIPVGDCAERSVALELLVLARIARGEYAQAEIALADLDAIAAIAATEPLLAAARYAAGSFAAAQNNQERACQYFEDAIDLYKRSGAPFETARVRIALAHTLVALGRTEAAGQQVRKAHDVLQQLGANSYVRRAAAILRDVDAATNEQVTPRTTISDLTPREIQILGLIAAGKSNQAIAANLVLSVRTVERHISNIYAKIGTSGPVARATATAFALQHDLTPGRQT